MTEPKAHRLYLDANVFIAAFETQNTDIFSLFVDPPRRPGPFLFTSLLTRAELLVHPYRCGNDRLISVYENWTESNEILSVGPIDAESLRYAAVLRAQYPSLKLPDAIHLSTAFGIECTHFVSFDQQFGQMPSISHTRYGMTRTMAAPTYVNPADDAFLDLVKQVVS